MAALNQLHFEDELACAICLKLFTDPVTIPCGHTICMKCITSYWDEEMDVEAGSCPKCHGNSSLKTQLFKNSVPCKDVKKVSKSVKITSEESCFNTNDAVCDFCNGKEVKATKYCLDCVASFCETHIRTHHENAALKLHKLVNAVKTVENGQCKRHKRPLDLFCRTDENFICCICIVQEHGNHTVVTIAEEREAQQGKLVNKGKTLERHAKATEIEIEDLRKQTDSIRSSTITLQEDITAKFNELIQDIKEAKLQIMEFIEKEEQVALSKTQETIAKKKEKSIELRKEKLVMEELSEIVDNIKFLQESKAFSSKQREPSSQDNCKVDIRFPGLDQVVINLKEQLVNKCNQLLENVGTKVASLRQYWPKVLEPRYWTELRMFYQQLTFDAKTAHKCLSLTKGNRKVTNIWPDEVYCVDHTERFDCCWQLLCAEKLDNGVHYWEVGISEGCCLGVTYKSIMRKGMGNSCFIGRNNRSWGIQMFSSHCSAWHNNVEVKTKSEKYEKIGVYLNYPNGILAFYAVSDMDVILLYRFQAVFTEPMYPGFRLIKSQSVCYIHDEVE